MLSKKLNLKKISVDFHPTNIYSLFIRLPRKQVWALRSYLNTSCPGSKSQFLEGIDYPQLSPTIQKYQFLILLYYCRRFWATCALTLSYSLITKTSKRTLLLAFPWFAKAANLPPNKDSSPSGASITRAIRHRPNLENIFCTTNQRHFTFVK